MGEPQGGSGSDQDGRPCGGPPDPLAHLVAVDLHMFARLHEGDPRPLRITLRDGRQVTGELKRIARGTDLFDGRAAWGRVLIATAGGDVEIGYSDIAEVA